MNLTIRNNDLLFVVMPWAFPDNPVIGPSILQRFVEEAGFHSQVLYPGFYLIQSTGQDFYNCMSNNMSCFEISEHFFSCYVHGPERVQSDRFFAQLQIQRDDVEAIFGAHPKDAFQHLRDTVTPQFVDDLAQQIANADVKAVGFSCTFNQIMASLAVAKKLKAINPNIITLFGGPSFDNEMGITHHQKYPSIIDHIFLGEADECIVDMVKNIRAHRPLDDVPGLTVYREGTVKYNNLFCIAHDLDTVPAPNYDDFFLQRREAEESGCELPALGPLTFESSRGCWWATKAVCSFCGLNGGRFDFRSKSPARVVSELEELSTRYSTLDFRSSDNIIDMAYFNDLFPVLEASGNDYSIWYQTKTSLKKEEIRALKRGRVTLVQAGIESLSDRVLKLMRKGLSGLTNIQFLKWCKEIGVDASYFILYGFPGETESDYDKVAEIVPLITHLKPPVRMQHIELHRFSPMFNDPEGFGIDDMFMRENSEFVYPRDVLDRDLLYTFRHYSSKTARAEQYTKNLRDAVDHWIMRYYHQSPAPVLEMRVGQDFLLIHDTRFGDDQRYYLNDIQKEVILFSDAICPTRKMYQHLGERFPHVSRQTLEEEIHALAMAGLVIIDKNRIFALPIRPRDAAAS